MLEELRLTNFQGFREQVKLPLAPITLIFGPNSSGKSSIIRSLLLMKQSTSSSARESDRFSFVDSDVDLGGFANVVHQHQIHEEIGVGVSFSRQLQSGNSIYGVDFSIRDGDFVRQITISGTIERALERAEASAHGEFALTFREDPDDPDRLELILGESKGLEALFDAYEASSRRRSSLDKRLKLDEATLGEESDWVDFQKQFADTEFVRRNLYVGVRDRGMWAASRIMGESELNDEAAERKIYLFRRFLEEIFSVHVRKLDNSFRSMSHLAGLRVIPDRFSNLASTPQHVSADASNIVSMLGSRSAVVPEASKWLSRLTGGAYELEVIKMNGRSIDFLGDVGSLVLRDTRLKTTTTFKDVGVGLSQVLPIIVALVQAGEKPSKKIPVAERMRMNRINPTLLLEQPELHLHPRMQAELTDLLIDSSVAKNQRGPQLIIETHSENIILRLQRRIREGRIRAADVSVLYVDRNSKTGQSQVKQLPLDDNGEFLAAWPEDFGVIRLDEILP